jgi:hypothetical protein
MLYCCMSSQQQRRWRAGVIQGTITELLHNMRYNACFAMWRFLLQVLSELIDLVASELGRQARELAAAAARSSEQEARLAGKAEDLAQLQSTLK